MTEYIYTRLVFNFSYGKYSCYLESAIDSILAFSVYLITFHFMNV